MEIHQLRTFVAVAHAGSITRASGRLCLSQPAVSAHIKTIEDSLGVMLFERNARGMSLTCDGRRILAKAELTLGMHRELIDEAVRIKGMLAGKLRLGAEVSSNSESIGQLLSRLSERYPNVEVELRQVSSLDLLDDIRTGKLDAGFYHEAGEPDEELATIEVSRFDICLAARPGLVAKSDPLDWQALAELPWIFSTASPSCWQAAENLFKIHKFRAKRIISVDNENVTRMLLAEGVGVGLLHGKSAREAQQGGAVDIVCAAQNSVRVLFAHLLHRAQNPLLSAVSTMLRSTVEA